MQPAERPSSQRDNQEHATKVRTAVFRSVRAFFLLWISNRATPERIFAGEKPIEKPFFYECNPIKDKRKHKLRQAAGCANTPRPCTSESPTQHSNDVAPQAYCTHFRSCFQGRQSDHGRCVRIDFIKAVLSFNSAPLFMFPAITRSGTAILLRDEVGNPRNKKEEK